MDRSAALGLLENKRLKAAPTVEDRFGATLGVSSMWVEVGISVGIAITADNLLIAADSLVGANPSASESMTLPVPTGTLKGFERNMRP